MSSFYHMKKRREEGVEVLAVMIVDAVWALSEGLNK